MTPRKLSRRVFLKTTAAVGGALVLGGITYRQIHKAIGRDFRPKRTHVYLGGIQSSPVLDQLPNLIIILCDDLGSCDIDSPALDLSNIRRMAAEGVRLTNFYAADFDLMKPGTCLVNTARVAQTDEQAIPTNLPSAKKDGNTLVVAAHKAATIAGELKYLLSSNRPRYILNAKTLDNYA